MADVGDAEAGNAVQIAAAILVPEMAALRAGVYPVVADELHRFGPRRIDVLRVQLRVLPQPLPEQVEDVESYRGATIRSRGLDVIHFNFYTVAGFSQESPAGTIHRFAGSTTLNDSHLLSVGRIYEKWSGMSSEKTEKIWQESASMQGERLFSLMER
jgi:hypothetical protein